MILCNMKKQPTQRFEMVLYKFISNNKIIKRLEPSGIYQAPANHEFFKSFYSS